MCYGNDDSSSSSSTSSPANTTSSTLLLWAANRLAAEPKNEIDADMMPPPTTTLPLNIRRSSLTGLLSCSPTDQISPPILKSELIDENSQSSILSTGGPDTMSHDSMDHFPSESSMDNSNGPSVIMPPTPMEIILQKNTALTSAFASTLNQNTLMGIATNGVDLRVKQEDMVAHIQEMVNQNSTDNSDVVPMFVGNANNVTDVMFNNPMRQLNTPMATNATTEQQIQHTLDQTNTFSTTHQSLMTEAGTAAGTLNHILSYPNSVPSNILNTSPTNNSPLSQDVMLNSQPAAAMTTPMINPNATPSPLAPVTIQSESDIILNPTISPTMMCNPNGDALTNQVAIGDSPMLSANISTTQQTTTSDAILTNLMQPMSIKQSANEVKNMILNAAADILSSEPHSITTETTMNALISFSQEQATSSTAPVQGATSPKLLSIHDGQSVQHFENTATQSLTNILSRSDSNSSVVVLAGDNQLIQNVVAAAAAQNATEIIQNQIPAETMLNHVIPNTISNPLIGVHQGSSPPTSNLNSAQQSYLNGLQ